MKLKLEILDFSKCFLVKAVEGSTTFRRILVDEFRLLNIVHLLDALAEVALVKFLTIDGLVEPLQLGQRKQVWQQFEADRFCLHLLSHQLAGTVYHVVMVAIHLGNIIHIHPFHPMFLTQILVIVIDVDKGIISYTDDTLTGVAVDVAEGSHLSHKYLAQARQFVKGTVGCIVQALVAADEASVEAPFAASGIHITLADKYLQLVVGKAEDDTVNGQQYFLKFRIIRSHDSCLPEISIECHGDAEDDNRVDDIPLGPGSLGGSNLFGSRCAEYQSLDFLLVGCLRA